MLVPHTSDRAAAAKDNLASWFSRLGNRSCHRLDPTRLDLRASRNPPSHSIGRDLVFTLLDSPDVQRPIVNRPCPPIEENLLNAAPPWTTTPLPSRPLILTLSRGSDNLEANMADASNLGYLYTIGGYATLFGVGYAIYHVSTQKGRKRASASQSKSTTKPSQSEPRKEDRKKKQRMESFTSDSQGSSEKAFKAKAPAKTTESSPFLSNVQANDTSDDVDNHEFAKQLSKAKQGTQFATSSDSGKKQKEKSVKQSRANQISAPADEKASAVSATSSGDGADADDDQSPARSPVADSTDSTGVADMLEPTPSGPSVLRLTDTESKDKKKKKKESKAAEPVETKKQRQNRKKAEAARVAREEAEKERRVLEEKQRRAARIAEGRPAKDGSQFTTASANKSSAWNQGAPNGGHAQNSGTNGAHQLLDTFDAPAEAEAPKPSAPSQTESAWMSSLPSEEEQLEMLKNEADEWSTVQTKSSKKSKKEASAGSGDDAPVLTRTAPQPNQPAPVASANNTTKAPQNFGSFSALTVKDEPEEDVEEEWDV